MGDGKDRLALHRQHARADEPAPPGGQQGTRETHSGKVCVPDLAPGTLSVPERWGHNGGSRGHPCERLWTDCPPCSNRAEAARVVNSVIDVQLGLPPRRKGPRRKFEHFPQWNACEPPFDPCSLHGTEAECAGNLACSWGLVRNASGSCVTSWGLPPGEVAWVPADAALALFTGSGFKRVRGKGQCERLVAQPIHVHRPVRSDMWYHW